LLCDATLALPLVLRLDLQVPPSQIERRENEQERGHRSCEHTRCETTARPADRIDPGAPVLHLHVKQEEELISVILAAADGRAGLP
jgi:hypothetical protein